MTKAIELSHKLRDMTSAFKTPSHERGVLNDAIEELRRLAAIEQEYKALQVNEINLNLELAGLKAAMGEPVAWHTEDHLTDRSATTYDKNMMYRWQSKGWPITPLYAKAKP